jgi:hypothetical protein
MRRFHVWCNDSDHIVEMPDDATKEECDEACKDALDDMIGTVCDTGWNELAEGEEPPK